MAKQDPGQLIDETRELTAMSRTLCESSRRTQDWSKRLKERAAKTLAFSELRRVKRLSKKKAG